MNNAYNQGRAAYYDSYRLKDNPFKDHAALEWEAGWWDSYDAEEGKDDFYDNYNYGGSD